MKIVLYVVIGIAVLFGLVALIGSFLERDHVATVTRR